MCKTEETLMSGIQSSKSSVPEEYHCLKPIDFLILINNCHKHLQYFFIKFT